MDGETNKTTFLCILKEDAYLKGEYAIGSFEKLSRKQHLTTKGEEVR